MRYLASMTDDRNPDKLGSLPEHDLLAPNEQLEAELQKVEAVMLEEDRFEAPKITDEMDDRLSALEMRAKEAKGVAAQKKDFVYREARGAKYHQDTGKGLSTGMVAAGAIIGGPMVGYGLGILLDNATGSNGWKPLIMILGAAIGIAFTVRYVNMQNGD